jgi:hypothetical protein
MTAKVRYHRRMFRIVALDVETCLYDMSYTELAEFFLSDVEDRSIRPGSEEAWFRRVLAEAYVSGQLKIPLRYRPRVRRAILQVRLD